MRHRNINEVNKDWLKQAITSDSVIVDATAGNGHDTLFCAGIAKHVYAFDIQKEAIENAKIRTSDFSNITYVLDSHATLNQYIHTPIDGIIFNLGYLPTSDKSTITQAESTLTACNQALELLSDRGFMLITCYLGHPGGASEAAAVKQWIDTHFFAYQSYTYENVSLAPISYFIEKRHRILD